jgi:hypothetical protein
MVVVVSIGGLAWGGYVLQGRTSGVGRLLRRETSPPSANPSTASSTPSPTPPIAAEVVRSFPGAALGARLNFWVDRLPRTPDCYTDAFPDVLAGSGAYYSDCKSWKDAGLDVCFFYVIVQNLTTEEEHFGLVGFEMSTREGETIRPIQLSNYVEDPSIYIPDEVTLSSRQVLKGWVTFDSLTDFVPARLTYRDGEQSLVIEFHGRHTRLPRR